MFTQDGLEVEVVREIDGGYLAKQVYYNPVDVNDDEINAYEKWNGDAVMFYEQLFDSAPIEKYADEIIKLKKEIDTVQADLDRVKNLRNNEQSLISKISKFPILQQLADYLTKDFSFVLYLNDLRWEKKDAAFHSPFIRTGNSATIPFALYKLSSERYFSENDDKPFMVFKTHEEMTEVAKAVLYDKVNKWTSNYNMIQGFRMMFSSISSTCIAKTDAAIVALYEKKLKLFTDIENKEKSEKLKQEVAALEAKVKELNQLENKQ